MHAIILAAGMGKRLKELTRDNTKCMVKVNGVTLIERVLCQLDRLNLSKVVLVVGYEGEKLKQFVGTLGIKTPIAFVENPIYDKTNNIYSLMLAKDYLLEDDTLLLESDIIFEDGVLEELISDPHDTLALVDKYESWMDGTCVTLSENDDIVDFISKRNFAYNDIDRYYKTVNVYKFSRHFSRTHYVPFLEAYAKALGNNEYYEQVLRVITMLDDPEIKAKKLHGQKWYEIDDIQDLDIAESLFNDSPDLMVKNISSRFGGYWRYPGMVDFCYLVNPYYPTKRLKDELKASFDELLTQYPSGMRVNSLLAAKNFGVRQEHIVVGNGAAELIKSLTERLIHGRTGIIRPTFEEYFNRLGGENTVVFVPDNDDLSYTSDDIMHFFEDKDIENLILI
ncbi:MAG: NTP transferase domain-containing protein, partial [Oscillospiraceae bacterium]